MLAQTVQTGGSTTWDWTTLALALVTGVMAMATVWVGQHSRKAVKVAEREASATLALVEEARRDRELAVQPVIVLDAEIIGEEVPHLRLRNIGRGPAVRTRIFQWRLGVLYWTGGPGFPIAVDEAEPPLRSSLLHDTVDAHKPLDQQRGAGAVSGIPGDGKSSNDLWVYCLDQLGSVLQFNLRTGDPPVISRPSDSTRPEWVDAFYRHQ